LALDAGALAARSFGAGFGGSVWALVPRKRSETFATEWVTLYREKFPETRGIVFLASPAPAVTEFRHR
jgi:galactokinase